jgi:hypothetical protein
MADRYWKLAFGTFRSTPAIGCLPSVRCARQILPVRSRRVTSYRPSRNGEDWWRSDRRVSGTPPSGSRHSATAFRISYAVDVTRGPATGAEGNPFATSLASGIHEVSDARHDVRGEWEAGIGVSGDVSATIVRRDGLQYVVGIWEQHQLGRRVRLFQ